MKRSMLAAMGVLLAQGAIAQAPAGTAEVTADGCKLYLPQGEAKGASRIRWSGKCTDGLADGRGVLRIYAGGKISRVAEATFAAGKQSGAGETYFIRRGQAVRSRGADQIEITASELPTWALELSMLVEDRPRAAPKPVAKAPEKDMEEAKRAEQQRQAEAQRARAEAKAAADKLAAERASQEAERKRLTAERERALADARAAAERAAAAEKRAAEKADRERSLAEARAAAEAKAAADKVAAEKSAQEAEQRRQQAEKERQLADAKAAADKAAQEAERQRIEAERVAAEKAKAAAERPRAPFVAGRGFGEGGAGEPMRGVVTFKLTTHEGRELGVATFVAGKGEAELRQNAAALASAYEKVSPFNAKLLEQPQVGALCGGPGYVVEARVTYPAARAYGWYAGCMGDNVESAAKAMQQLEEQLHRDFKASPTSFWAYQYLIVGYVDAATMRSSGDYERVAKPGLMAPGRVMVLSRPEQWAECTVIVNKDPKLRDKTGCLREAVDKLKTSLRR